MARRDRRLRFVDPRAPADDGLQRLLRLTVLYPRGNCRRALVDLIGVARHFSQILNISNATLRRRRDDALPRRVRLFFVPYALGAAFRFHFNNEKESKRLKRLFSNAYRNGGARMDDADDDRDYSNLTDGAVNIDENVTVQRDLTARYETKIAR